MCWQAATASLNSQALHHGLQNTQSILPFKYHGSNCYQAQYPQLHNFFRHLGCTSRLLFCIITLLKRLFFKWDLA